MTTTRTKIAKLLGTTDECTQCQLCGREELKHTVVIEFLDTGEIVHAGSDCAARALGWTQATVRSRARSADRAAYDQAWQTYTHERDRTDNDSIRGPLVSRPRERCALRDLYMGTTDDKPIYPIPPQRPAHLSR